MIVQHIFYKQKLENNEKAYKKPGKLTNEEPLDDNSSWLGKKLPEQKCLDI